MKKYGKGKRLQKELGLGRSKRRKKKKVQNPKVPDYLYSPPVRIKLTSDNKKIEIEINPKQKPTYQDFLKTKVWKKIRRKVLKRDKYKCVHCKRPARNVHHKNYDAEWGKEKLSSLESVCIECHEVIHGLHEPKMPEITIRKKAGYL